MISPESAEASHLKAIRYKNPPIIERSIAVVSPSTPEEFLMKFETWRTVIAEHFPEYDPVKKWDLNIEMKNGVPMVHPDGPRVEVTPRFWHRSSDGRRLLSMRLTEGVFVLNLMRLPSESHIFEDLAREFEIWFPRWASHFGAVEFPLVSLDYINLLSPATTPQFITRNGLQLGDVLTVFNAIPTNHRGIIPPYDCQVGLNIDEKRGTTFALRVQGLVEVEHGPQVRVDFHAQTSGQKPLTMGQVIAETGFLRRVVREHFEALFTESAKNSFEVIK